MINKKKILILTTKNCCGCTIQIEHVQTAIAKTSKDIELEIKDFNDVPKRFIHENKITDYPTTLYIQEGITRFKYIGSCPVVMIQRFIDIYLK